MQIETKEFEGVDDATVYVSMNNFNYDKLIDRIIKHTGMGDTELTDGVIQRIFKDLAKVFNQNKRKELTPEEVKVAETFMKDLVGLRFSDYEDEEASEFYVALSEAMEWSLQNFQEVLTGAIPLEEVSDTSKDFYDALLELMDAESMTDEEDGELAMATLERLQEILSDYVSGEFDELQLAILAEMEKNLLDGELITGLQVENRPGRVVKHGDSLVTFPLILMKATGNGY